MLRIHFTDADLGRVRTVSAPDPLWEVASSLHRFQTRHGRWAYMDWYRDACAELRERDLARTVRNLLLPLFPRAAYFPDFLTPAESAEGMEAGLQAVLAAPRQRVRHEAGRLAAVGNPPPWLHRLADADFRTDLVGSLRAYYAAVVKPHLDDIQTCLDVERASCARALLDGGTEELLRGLTPGTRWAPPVLEVNYCEERDLHLEGRGLVLIPSFFCWAAPVALADNTLAPMLVYPARREPPSSKHTTDKGRNDPLSALLGRTRAAVLLATHAGATCGELARIVGVSAATVSSHTHALREAHLITSRRYASSVLHTLTPLGTALIGTNRR